MKNLFLHLAVVMIGMTGSVSAQGFDLMNMQPSNKLAVSSPYIVSNAGIEQYSPAATTVPYSVISGDTLFVTPEKTTSVADGGTMITASSLHQNYPNPFNNATVIRFSVNELSEVTITVFDMTGREVTTLVNGTKQNGTFSVGFSNTNISSGTYVYRMTARSITGKTTVESKKMIVMK